MKTKNKIIISLTLSALTVFIGSSVALATESAWQNLNSNVIETGLSGTAHNCSPLTVANGSVAAYPSCAISCNSGYTLSGSSCNASGGGFVGGGGGGAAAIIPTTSISINSGASITNSRNATLSLVASGASLMMISNLSTFSDVSSWETFAASKPWVLTAGDGTKTVYAKFRTSSGNEYNSIFDSITLQVGAVVPTTTTTTTTSAQTTTTTSTTGVSGTQSGVASYTFTRPMSLGSTGAEVTALQNRLISEGVYSGAVTGYYGSLTMAAVKLYQAKYGIDQLGSVGPSTRARLNSTSSTSVSATTTQMPQNISSMTLKSLIQLLLQMGAIATDKIETAQKIVDSL